jgi:poly(A) polymerase
MKNPAIEILRRATAGTEYDGRLFLVGGVVRDKVMGRLQVEDIDIVLEGDALALARFLYKSGVAEHRPVTYPRFGTAMIVLDGRTVELVSARRESYAPTSRKPDVEPAGLYEDVMRRDFTINTLLENLNTGEIHDLTGSAISDIQAGIIRTPTEPESTFFDDPLRMLRAIRFAVKFGFKIDEGTYAAIIRDAQRLSIISRERIRDEFAKILLSDEATRGLQMLKETGLLTRIAPECSEMQGVTQTGGHIYDVWDHTLHALDALHPDADLTLRLAVLYHDTGKPKTRTVGIGGATHFYGHADLSADVARKALTRLRFAKSQTARVVRLVSMHMRVGEYRGDWKDSAVRRLMRDAGDDISDLIALAKADRLGANPKASIDDLCELERRLEHTLLKIQVSEFRSPLNGDEIMDLLHIPPGPIVKDAKHHLVDEIIEGRLMPGDKEAAASLIVEKFGGKS